MSTVAVKEEEVELKENVTSCVSKDGIKFAGIHLLIDLWGACNLNNPQEIDVVLRKAAQAAGATVLFSNMHQFAPYGVSGVVVLAESHISIHTWPERSYAALDVFMCGNSEPYAAIEVLKEYFAPNGVQIIENKRGVITDDHE